jgi:hypothetical protein
MPNPKQMQLNLMKSNECLESHPNDSIMEHFYRKNQIEFPKYEYHGNGNFVRNNDSMESFDNLNQT